MRRQQQQLVAVFSVLAAFFLGGRAQAGPIGQTTFDGDVWSLEQLTATTFQLTVDTDGSDSQNYISAVAINLGGASTGGSLLADTAPGTWTYVDGGTDSGGCNGNGASFDCAQWTSGALAFDTGAIYTWTWTITGPVFDTTKDHLKAVYYDGKGTGSMTDDTFFAQMSSDITPGATPDVPVPEPATLLLLGSGLTLAVRNRRAKR